MPTTTPRVLRPAPRLWHEPDHWRDAHPWAVPIVQRLRDRVTADGLEQPTGPWFAELAERRAWSDATISLYARALQAAGHDIPAPSMPTPEDGPRSLPLLWELGERPSANVLRVAAWARVAAGWPAEVEAWHQLYDHQLELDGDDVFVAGRRVLGAAPMWRRWRDWCDQQLPAEVDPTTRAALVRTRAADRSAPAGERLSVRGMQDAFKRAAVRAAAISRAQHAAAVHRGDPDAAARTQAATDAYAGLSYDTDRRLMLRAGAQPPRPDSRGAVRYR
jgi:hypothetical protein